MRPTAACAMSGSIGARYSCSQLLVLAALLCVAAPGTVYGQEALEESVDALFTSWDKPFSPGAAVGIVHEGRAVYRKGYGLASLEHGIAITPSTAFDIASVSKQFCAFAIALLASEGAIDLEDDIRSLLPEMPDFGITIRHLVHHTSGLRDWPGTLAAAGYDMEDVISFDEILAMARAQQALNFSPGEEYSYSNTGYNLLAEIVARRTGKSFRAYTDEAIFKPLGMHRSHFRSHHEEVVPNRAYAYAPSEAGYRRVGNNLVARGSSSLFSSVDDLVRWTVSLSERRLGGPAPHELMALQGVLNSGEAIPYAFGQVAGTYRGLETLSHTGSWAGFRSVLLRFPEEDFAVIILGNVSTMNPMGLARRIADLYLGHLMADPDAAPAEMPPAPESLDDYVGTYDFGQAGIVQITASEGRLFARLAGGARLRLARVGEDRFAAGSAFVFSRDAGGTVVDLEWGGRTGARVATFAPDAGALAAYEGRYESPELDYAYAVVAGETGLWLHGARGEPIELVPVAPDAFTTESWFMPFIRFVRGSGRQIVAFEATNARSRRMRFDR